MAYFEIVESEGMRWVKATLRDETIRTQKRALNHFMGDIKMDVPLPGLRTFWQAAFTEEAVIRPTFTGSGEVHLDSWLGGFHILEIGDGEAWIIEDKVYWASEDRVRLSIMRERMSTSFWADEGLFWYRTGTRGPGQVVLRAPGPVEEITLNNERLVMDGSFVLARTSGVRFSIGRPAGSRFRHMLSGQGYARIYQGTGRILLCTTPYWRLRILQGGLEEITALV